MSDTYKTFNKKSEEVSFDLNHRKTIQFNMGKYQNSFTKGKALFGDLETARQRAANIKMKVLNNLDQYLIDFESNFEKNGGKVLWAEDKDEAIRLIQEIAHDNNVKSVVKSKSMTTEEVSLNEAFEEKDIDVLETDLGEYIVQLAGEHPYHIVTPAMHKSRKDIQELFNKKFNKDLPDDPVVLTAFVRDLLRQKFTSADMGVTGANFLLADIGGIAITENEGNAFMTYSWPKVHVALVGMEKLLPSVDDLDLFWSLLSVHGTGQHLTSYNSVITGPKRESDIDGPEKMYVILMDNGRSDLLAQSPQKRALSCIRCGACLNACPVYKNIGGHTYDTTYSGPIGSVITPFLRGVKEYKHLSFASSLCGACTEVCPVKIPLHELLLFNRNHAVKNKHYTTIEKIGQKGAEYAFTHRSFMDITGGGMKNMFMKMFVKNAWGPRRELPEMAKKSFSQMWKEKEKEKDKE
ncbi:MAG: LutB/LldF family L-lactate oxidation iron-sulfur protein [Bacteroidales bacterium]